MHNVEVGTNKKKKAGNLEAHANWLRHYKKMLDDAAVTAPEVVIEIQRQIDHYEAKSMQLREQIRTAINDTKDKQ